jgi:hypothetical protein
MRALLKAALAVAAFFIFSTAAFADTTASTGLNVGDIINQALPGIVETLTSLVLLAILWLAALIHKKTGVDIEAQVRTIEAAHRDALHSAVETALGAAVSKFGLNGLNFNPGNPVAAFIVGIVKSSVPEAVTALGATEQWILNAAQAKLGQTVPVAAT